MTREVRLLDERVRPDPTEELLLGHDLAGLPHEGGEQLHGPRGDLEQDLLAPDQAAPRVEAEGPEFEERRPLGHRVGLYLKTLGTPSGFPHDTARPAAELGSDEEGAGHERGEHEPDGRLSRSAAAPRRADVPRGEAGPPLARAADAAGDHLRPPHPAGAGLDGGLRGPLRGERPAPVAPPAREPGPRPQLAGRQPRRHARPLPRRRAAAVRLLRGPPRRRARRPPRAGRTRAVGSHEPPRGRGPPGRVLPAGDRDLPRHLRDRPLQDLVGPARRHRAADPARGLERGRALPAPADPGRRLVARVRRRRRWRRARPSSASRSAPGSGGPGRSLARRAGPRRVAPRASGCRRAP